MKNLICLAIGMLSFAARLQAAINVVDYWHLGENDPGAVAGAAMSNSLDIVGGHTLTNSGALTYSTNVSASASVATGSYLGLQFTNNAFATSAAIPGLTTNFGVELWVNPATASGAQSIFYNGNSGGSGWGLYVSGNTFAGLFGGVSFIFGSVTFTPGTWNHVALVKSGTVATLYVNGAVSATLARTPNSPAGQITVGANFGATENFSGLIDEIRVFTFAANQFSTNDLLLHQTPIFTISLTNLIEAPAGGTDTVSVAVTPTNVSWAATADAQWLHLAVTNGAGNATISFSFDANTNSGATPRSGALTIASQNVTITQGCPIAITSANNATFATSLSNSFTFIAVDVPAPTFTTSSALPTGVSLSPAGVLSGVPPDGSGGVYPLTIVASNGISPNAARNFTLNVIERSALVVNPVTFNTNGWGWSLNGDTVNDGFSINNNVFTPTDGGFHEATSAWYDYPLYVGDFLASFTYRDSYSYSADGIAFVLQNDPRATAALGGNGGYLGYVGITPSVAAMLDIYFPSGFQLGTDAVGDGSGFSFDGYQTTAPVDLDSGDPIAVTLQYSGGILNLTFADTVSGSVYQTSCAVDIPGLMGTNRAWVGFTGGTGSVPAYQTISDFTYSWPFSALSLSTNLLDEPAAAGSDSVTLSVSPGSVAWTATANVPWLHLAASRGAGGAAIGFSIDANTPPNAGSRTGTLIIAGNIVTVTQAAPTYTVAATNFNESADAGADTVALTVSLPNAAWTASADTPWLHLSEAGGAGSSNLVFSFDQNTALGPRTGSLTVAGATVTVNQAGVHPATLPVTFNTTGLGWVLNGDTVNDGFSINNNVFTPTDNGFHEATSAWYDHPVYVGDFLASFTYRDSYSYSADGIAFVLQNDPRATAALGGNGGYLGYVGITPSVAAMLDIFFPSGFQLGTDAVGDGSGFSFDGYQTTGSVDLDSGDPIAVTLQYSGGILNLTFADTVSGSVYQTSCAVDIPGLMGTNVAWVGFTGSDGGVPSYQTISDFTYSWPLALTIAGSGPEGSRNIQVSFTNNPYATFTVLTTTNLAAPPASWSVAGQATNMGNGLFRFGAPGTNARQYFRVTSP